MSETLQTQATNEAPEVVVKEEREAIKLMDLWYLCVNKWYWFVISLVVCLGLASYYLLTTPKIYTRDASLLIKEEGRGKNATTSTLEEFSNLGMFASRTNINNEMGAIMSPDLMAQVIKRLNLDIDYSTDGRFHRKTLYGQTLPVNVDLSTAADDSTSCSFEMVLHPNGTVTLSDFEKAGEDVKGKPVTGKIATTLTTPIGRLTVLPSQYYKPVDEDLKIYVDKTTVSGAKKAYSKRLTVTQDDEKATILNLSFTDVSPARANDVLANLILCYNENWVQDKNKASQAANVFISERLGVIEGELGNVDSDISSYKSEHLLPDVNAAANLYMQQATNVRNDVQELNTQLYMAKYVRNYLASNDHATDLIPVTSGISDLNIGTQIKQYNDALLERNSLANRAGEKNPMVAEMDRNLASMRAALINSIDNQIVALSTNIQSLNNIGGQATSQIASNPVQAKYLLSVERQQKVKEALYLYLLQKREENELNQAFTAYNTRIISAPDGSSKPTSPVTGRILLIAFVAGLAIPVGIIYVREIFNTMVRGRKDIESLTIPFVGEIPEAYKIKKSPVPFLKKKVSLTEGRGSARVVKRHSRNVINEAFRVVRTNLEFMLDTSDGKTPVIAVTSANPGSGKTFCTYNLAASLKIKNKRVLAIDLDLRKGSLSKYVDSPSVGISDYLAGKTNDIDSIIVRGDQDQPDIIPMGTMPPNPTELLFSGQLETLIDTLKGEYDYIFLDCPPVEIVADAAIINTVADRTIFIIRAGLFDRSMLPEVERLYTSGKYHNMAILLNGTDAGTGYYGAKYGYRYGYRYGYHYGYSSYTKE